MLGLLLGCYLGSGRLQRKKTPEPKIINGSQTRAHPLASAQIQATFQPGSLRKRRAEDETQEARSPPNHGRHSQLLSCSNPMTCESSFSGAYQPPLRTLSRKKLVPLQSTSVVVKWERTGREAVGRPATGVRMNPFIELGPACADPITGGVRDPCRTRHDPDYEIAHLHSTMRPDSGSST